MKQALVLAAALVLCACSPAPDALDATAPATAKPAAAGDWTLGGMVSAAHPDAVDAARTMLENGGHAVDAAIAAHAVLGLVEPESSGLGGSAFMLVFERSTAATAVYDGRETAPRGATADMFMRNGEPMGFRDAWQTGLSVGVPGTVALYEAAHAAHGRLSWADLFQPAIALARDGYEVSPKLHNWLVRLQPMVRADISPAAAAYLYPEGEPMPVGYRHRNPDYADTLSRIAAGGSGAFYRGELAQAIVERAQRPPGPGPLALDDLAGYEVVRREAVCGAFRDGRICSAPPPSSGLAQIMIAGLYDRLLPDGAATEAERVRALVDAQRLAYADRDRYVADPDFADVPASALIAAGYLDRRAAERFSPSDTPVAGDPFATDSDRARPGSAAQTSAEQPGTSHLSIVDRDGNAVSLTASVGAPFGSLRLARGFLLNNEMSDFALAPTERGVAAVNAIAPGKRPRSSMSPTMVFGADGGLRMVTGSPGGNSIVAYVAKSIVAVLDWEYAAQDAADFPNIIARGADVRVENADETGQAIADALVADGYTVQESEGENSGLHLIVVHPDRLEGAADRRRDGSVARVQAE